MSSQRSVYPSDFNQRIFNKKETKYYISQGLPEDADLEAETGKKCGSFRLSNTQKFLKSFMNSESEYRSLLLYHGVGTGKTCTSISIAEQFSAELERNHKKIIVVLNPSIQENFRKNIFNLQNYKSKKVNQQCLRDKYLKMLKSKKFRSDEELMAKINRKINSKYKFIGYQALVNLIAKWDLDKRIDLNAKIRDYFEGSVMIIDEVHNVSKPLKVKLDEDGNPIEEGRPGKLPDYLQKIVENTENLKLLLLSATPMFNEPNDIVPLINLLRVNSGLLPVDPKALFKGRELKSRDALIKATTGLVSYLRSENPLAFPKRLYPARTELIRDFPLMDFKGERLPEENRIRTLKIIPCKMSGNQLDIYRDVEGKFGSFESVGINVSNIVFPTEPESTKAPYSQEGLFQTFVRNYAHQKKFKLMPNFKNPASVDFLKMGNIANYSAKIKAILENIKKCKDGIVFVYSRYVWAGVVAIALALEVNGASNINGNLIDFKQTDYQDPRNTGKYLGLEDRAKSDLPSPGKLADPRGDFKGYTYTLITGNSDLSEGAYKKYLSLEPRNKNGERVKIILGSESASEGLDFKYIREVHMLDPWFHLNKLEQVIGRGIRNCSHIDLPREKRNVTVYHYASIKPGDITAEPETIDLKIYREAENKDIHIAEVEHTLKENAIDCEINKNNNLFVGPPFNKPFDMVDSRGETRRGEVLSDEDYSRMCNYGLCVYDCGVKSTKPEDLDTSTFNHRKLGDIINEAVDDLLAVFNKHSYLRLEQIVLMPELAKYSKDREIVYLALDRIMSEEIPIVSPHKADSRLVYSNGYYLAVDNKYHKTDKSGMKLKLGDVSRPLMKRTMKVDLTPSVSKFVEKKTYKKESASADNASAKSINSIDTVMKKIFTNEFFVWNLNENDRRTFFKFIWDNSKLKGVSVAEVLNAKCRELFPTEYANIDVAIEDLVLKATDKTSELLKIKASLMITEWYVSQTTTSTGYFFFSSSDNVIKVKLMEWVPETGVFVEREQSSKPFNTLLRKLDFNSKTAKSKLLGFIDSDGKFKIRDNVKKTRGKNTGRECETYTAKNILDYMASAEITRKYPTGELRKKDTLCLLLILSMIASNSPDLVSFITLEDASYQKVIKN